MIDFPRPRIAALLELAARLLDSRKPGTSNEVVAREMLGGVFDVCMHWGLDRVLDALDAPDHTGLVDHPKWLPAMIAQLDTIDLDAGGPRNAKPGILIDRVIAALELAPVDEVDHTIVLDDGVRVAVTAALTSVVDVELAIPHLRDTIVSQARARCEPRYHGSFDKLAAQLDERGMRIVRQPKVPLDAVQAIQQLLFETRIALVDRVVRAAVDRAVPVIANASAEAAARIDQPITARLTPRDVAVLRAADARVPKATAGFVASLIGSLELAGITWRAAEKPVRAYAASQTFAVGDLLEHPKFGRGAVTASLPTRMVEVEFADGKHTLVHARG